MRRSHFVKNHLQEYQSSCRLLFERLNERDQRHVAGLLALTHSLDLQSLFFVIFPRFCPTGCFLERIHDFRGVVSPLVFPTYTEVPYAQSHP